MPNPGMSLFGFMDEPFAHEYLKASCEGLSTTSTDLSRAWQHARKQLGPAIANAGQPDVQPLPKSADPHLRRVQTQNPRFKQTVAKLKWSFRSVEIDPVLCFQFHIEKERSAKACSGISSSPPGLAELLKTCLPITSAPLKHQVAATGTSFFIRSHDLNIRLVDVKAGPTAGETWTTQIVWGPSTPLVSVVRYGGRYYLNNGYHRAHGLRAAGVTHMPCVVLEANAWSDFIDPTSLVFSETLLSSSDPPTMAHFTQGRATEVDLRPVTRFIQVSWSELALPDHD